MTRARTRRGCCSIALVAIWLGFASSSVARDDGFKIIVHRSNPITTIERDFLRDAFLKKVTRWNHGESIRPIDLAKGQRARDQFSEEVLHKSPAQVRSYWSQRIFSGTDIPPVEVDSPAAAVAYVAANVGAVSYIPVDADPGAAKVIKIE